MALQVEQARLAEVFRLRVAGLSVEEISKELTTRGIGRYPADPAQVERDVAAIDRIMAEYGDPEKSRTAIALDLDRLFRMLLDDLENGFNWTSRPGARAEFYKQGAQLLMQKALLYGLNSENVTVTRNTKLVALVQQLRQLDATQLATETDYLPSAQSDDLPLAITAPERLPVTSSTGNGW